MRLNKNLLLWILGLGLILSLFMVIVGWTTINKCNNNIGCFLFIAIPLLPGFLLKLEGISSILASFLFWFLMGSLIGFLIYKFKKTK